jgi:RimJ/RimL family protein N-acetyltransferase
MGERLLPELRTPRICLQPATAADLDGLWALWTDPEVRRFLWDDVKITRDRAHRVLTDCLRRADEGLGLWTLHTPPDDRLFGCVGLLPVGAAAALDPGLAGGIEPVVALTPTVWGRGYATEALEAVAAYGFSVLGLGELVATADLPNLPSQRLLARVGFALIGERTGGRYPLRIYGLTASRFRSEGAE